MTNGTRGGWGISVRSRPLLTPGKYPVSLIQEVGSAPGPGDSCGKSRPPPGFDPQTVQPIASRYTDYATQIAPTGASVVSQQCELNTCWYERFSNSRNVSQNLELHYTWKLTPIRLQKDTFQKPWNQASVFQLNYSCTFGNASGLKMVLQNS